MSSLANTTSTSTVDQVILGCFVTLFSMIGCISNGLSTYFLATDAQFRHSTGIICINTTFANFSYSAIYMCYVGPMMIIKLGFTSAEPMPSLSIIVWFLFFVGQYFSFCLSMNRAIAVLLPLLYYQHATVRITMYICLFIWIFSMWHLLFFLLKICPGIYFNAVQSYLIKSTSSAPKQCVDFLRVNVEMYLLIGLSTVSLCTDIFCAVRVLFSSAIRDKMKASDLQFLYQSLFSSIFLCFECFLAGYIVANVVIDLTLYFIFTTLNRVIGRAISGILVLCFHRKLRSRVLLTALSICLRGNQQVILVHPLRNEALPDTATKDSNKSTDTNGSTIRPHFQSVPI